MTTPESDGYYILQEHILSLSRKSQRYVSNPPQPSTLSPLTHVPSRTPPSFYSPAMPRIRDALWVYTLLGDILRRCSEGIASCGRKENKPRQQTAIMAADVCEKIRRIERKVACQPKGWEGSFGGNCKALALKELLVVGSCRTGGNLFAKRYQSRWIS